MAKRTPKPCSEANCGELYPRCGTTTTIYTRYKCRCDACYEVHSAATKKWRSENAEHVQEYGKRWREENHDAFLEALHKWQDENREYTREYARQYREENGEAALEATRLWRQNNPDKVRDYQTEYNKNNRPALREYQLEYRQANPEFHRNSNQRRRAKQKEAFVEDVDRVVVFDRDGWVCQGCGIECPKDAVWPALDFATLDHIIPLAKGGEHSYANVQTLCLSCNSAKGDRE